MRARYMRAQMGGLMLVVAAFVLGIALALYGIYYLIFRLGK